MDFDSILRFFNFKSKDDKDSANDRDADTFFADNGAIAEINPADIHDFSESFKLMTMLDESSIHDPANVNNVLDDTFLYHNDDITAIDLNNTENIQWNSFLNYDSERAETLPINATEKQTVTVDPLDILDSGNNIIFASDEFDTIHFADEGWNHIEHIAGDTQGTPSYDVFMHVDTGAVIQVDSSIMTYQPEG